jgi:SAM-dependent methyltransferase
VPRHEDRLLSILERLSPFRKTNRIVDVGCSAAFFLMLAREKGWDVRGVEVSDFGVRYSRDVLGIDVFQGTLQDAAFPDGSFDVVFSSHVIEHIADPCDLLREMSRILRPGGAIVTVVPTQLASPSFRLFGKLTGESPPRHVSFFTKPTFNRMLIYNDFKIIYSEQNIELLKIYSAIRGGDRDADAAATPGASGGQAASSSSPGSLRTSVVRSMKSIVNSVGSLVGIGDELTTIAVKCDSRSMVG